VFVGIFVLALGVLFLLRNAGFLSGDIWKYIWPLALIALGISMLLSSKRPGRKWKRD
jgi:membrane-associated PAP2 superfamily phosphatase